MSYPDAGSRVLTGSRHLELEVSKKFFVFVSFFFIQTGRADGEMML